MDTQSYVCLIDTNVYPLSNFGKRKKMNNFQNCIFFCGTVSYCNYSRVNEELNQLGPRSESWSSVVVVIVIVMNLATFITQVCGVFKRFIDVR